MKIVLSVADLQPESGGPSRSVSALATSLAQLGNDVSLIGLKYAALSAPLSPPAPVRTMLIPCSGTFAKHFQRSTGFEEAIREACGDSASTVLHDNGLWLPTNHSAARLARKWKMPFIVSTRGMLTPWAMAFHGLKKRLAWLAYQRRDLRSAHALHATSHQEAEEVRSLGFTQPVAMIPNGVALPPAEEGSTILTNQPENSPDRTRIALFLSRIHLKKGLFDLVDAWHAVKPPGWKMIVAGVDENGHQAEVKARVSRLGMDGAFSFAGPIQDAAKWDLYRQADLFILPTKSENFGIVIAEALAAGVPVITTRGTPWKELEQHQCGWWTEIGAEPLAEALRTATQMSDADRLAMGKRGRQLIEDKYTWPAAAQKMMAVYQWMLGKGDRPECIV